ncbi:LANO_0D09120g1_1 [Lachancea nothofagi CBS 11611]|uniref:LANO_0D09120g1_1 n=1 Tax=Lachancea nothofagi CBS 11611 TaxID=1266666 RepID=A0A1G4JJE6_9SACH|nr:LANO_0D09120g1_1 [Lachancea nothofagi CBS 11611]
MFAAIASGNPLQLSTEVPNSNSLQHTIVLSSTKPKSYSHISLFILPNVTFPPDFAGTVYFKLSPTEEFKLFGYLSAEKPSAIFKVRIPNANNSGAADDGDGLGEIDMEDDISGAGQPACNISEIIIGISIEPKDQALAKLQEIKLQQASGESSSSLVVARASQAGITSPGQLAQIYPILTQQLAAKIVKHAHNYLTGFLDLQGNVPIKAFDAWWNKFKMRLEKDGQFLNEVTED